MRGTTRTALALMIAMGALLLPQAAAQPIVTALDVSMAQLAGVNGDATTSADVGQSFGGTDVRPYYVRERTSSGSSQELRTRLFLQFDLSDLVDPALPITEAYLRVHQFNRLNTVNSADLELARVSDPWSTTAGSLPVFDTTGVADAFIFGNNGDFGMAVTASGYYSGTPGVPGDDGGFDVTRTVQSWQDGSSANHGLRLAFADLAFVGAAFSAVDDAGTAGQNEALQLIIVQEAAPATAPYVGSVLADDPILYYRLNETAGPVAANSGSQGATGDGTYAGSVAYAQSGPRPSAGQPGIEYQNTAPDFPGSGSPRVDIPAGVLPAGNDPRTIEGWINGTSSTSQSFLNYGQNSRANRMSVTAGPDCLAVAVHSHNYGVDGLNLTPGWHHVAVVLPDIPNAQSDDWQFFIDGVDRTAEATTLAASGGPPFTIDTIDNANRRIGLNEGGGIDEVAVYSRALTGANVFSHYAAAIGMTGVASASGHISPIARPPSVAVDRIESDDTVFFFQEAANVVLAQDLSVDITRAGTYGGIPDTGPFGEDVSQGGPGVIPAGTEVHSYYLHYDTETSGPRNGGSITFENAILGVITSTTGLKDADAIFGELLSTQGVTLDPDATNADLFTLSEDGHTISFNFLNGGANVDQVRIMTAVPEPATVSLLAFGALGLLARRRRR